MFVDLQNLMFADFQNLMFADLQNLMFADIKNLMFADLRNLMFADLQKYEIRNLSNQNIWPELEKKTIHELIYFMKYKGMTRRIVRRSLPLSQPCSSQAPLNLCLPLSPPQLLPRRIQELSVQHPPIWC